MYTEPTHDQGAVATAVRTTSVISAEGRQIVDAVDKVFLLEPNVHPFVTLLTNVGRNWDGKTWQGAGISKASTGNVSFDWFKIFEPIKKNLTKCWEILRAVNA